MAEQTTNNHTPLEETAGYVRLALPLMSQHNIPITPRNYAIWYDYVSGKSRELREAIDAMLEKAEQFTDEINDVLYQRFCAELDEGALTELRDNLRRLLIDIFSQVAQLTEQAGEYESIVSKSVDKLSEGSSIQDIRAVVDDLIVETKKIGHYGRATQEKLQEATDELEHLKKEFEQAKAAALVDFLTGIGNRKAFDMAIQGSVKEAASNTEPLSLLLIDIDHFKRFNDEYGHIVGDEVLRLVVRKIKENVRGRDFVARYGGEEFSVILPGTPILGAKTVAENIRLSFSEGTLKRVKTSEYLGTITVSLGAAQYRPGESVESLVNRSDRALYFAKHSGRNRVATESDLAGEQ
jgi:diguanylate cyclase